MPTAEDQQAVREWMRENRELYEDEEPQEFDSVADAESRESAYREASKHFMEIMNASFVYIFSNGNALLAGWQVAYALGLRVCDGMSAEERATQIKCTRQAISQGAKIFQRGNGLPMPEWMRDSASACAAARTRQLTS